MGKTGRSKIEGKQRQLTVDDSKKVKFNIPEDKIESDKKGEIMVML